MAQNLTKPYVRTEMTPPSDPPASTVGIIGWVRTNLFSNWMNSILTIVGIYIAYIVASKFIAFSLIDAVWTGEDGKACRNVSSNDGLIPDGVHVGACWAYVDAKFSQYMYGFYPEASRWRVNLTYLVGALLIIPMAMPTVPHKKWNAIALFVLFPLLAYVLLSGGSFGLEHVETTQWGGLLLTLVIAVTGIVASLPLGIVLALGRRSKMPIVRLVSTIFIEFWRGIPLITVLFMSSVMLPLFMPEGVTLDKIVRPLIGVALFSTAYMAEVIRGGLQAIPKGQYEGAMALGLNFWKMMGLIVLPQALKLVIPGIVNTFIGLFKDTSLVSIIGLLDLLGIMQTTFSDAKWSSPVTAPTGYIFVALIYWVFCFGMSRYSVFMEELLHTGHKR